MLVGTEREKREEGVPNLVTHEEGTCVSETYPSVFGYTEVSTSQYKGFRTLANLGLKAVLLDMQQKRKPKEKPSRPPMRNKPGPSPSAGNLGSKSPTKDQNKDCLVM